METKEIIMHPLNHELEEMKKIFYAKFHEKHEQLLKDNPAEYHQKCRQYVDAKIYDYWINEYVRKGK